ncbi:preprotein translocase subunit YajC [Neisseria shayeganii]|nr:preprotein translocase subunit YajC [Neisseria shayeganii]QMT39629.1 preprotein translocase subunit YajC [Neisseria shayeganii]
MISFAFADGAAAAQQPSLLLSSLPWIFLLALFYFMILRPRQEEKRRQQMLAELKKGDKVMTTSGMTGKVSKVGEQYVTLEIAPGVPVEFHRQAITVKIEG